MERNGHTLRPYHLSTQTKFLPRSPRNGRHFADVIFKRIFVNDNCSITGSDNGLVPIRQVNI